MSTAQNPGRLDSGVDLLDVDRKVVRCVVGVLEELAYVDSVVFLFGADPHADGRMDGLGDRERDDEGVTEDHTHAEELVEEKVGTATEEHTVRDVRVDLRVGEEAEPGRASPARRVDRPDRDVGTGSGRGSLVLETS